MTPHDEWTSREIAEHTYRPERMMLSDAIAAMPRNGVADAIAANIARNTKTDREAYDMADHITTRLTHHLSKRETPPPPDHVPVHVHEPEHVPGEPAPGSGFGFALKITGLAALAALMLFIAWKQPTARLAVDVWQAQEMQE